MEGKPRYTFTMVSIAWTLGIAVLALVPYFNSLWGDIVYDDHVAVIGNADALGLRPLTELFYHDFWGNPLWNEESWTHHSYRPLTVLTFRLDSFFNGSAKFTLPFHVSNLLWYFCCILVVASLFKRVFGNNYAAAVATTVFAFNPIHAECAANITTRAETISSTFVLLAVLVLLPNQSVSVGNGIARVCGGVLCTLVAVLAKETGVMALLLAAPLSILMYCLREQRVKGMSLRAYVVKPLVWAIVIGLIGCGLFGVRLVLTSG